jgi:hypothetical protein
VLALRALVVHKLLCAAVGVAVAYAMIHGRPEAMGVAALTVAGMAASASRQVPVAPVHATRRAPSFHSYVTAQVGSPLRPLAFLHRLLLRPLAAPSPAAFWRQWNPPLGYLLLFHVYRPLRQVLPRHAAALATFIASGFLLHDLPANGMGVFNGWADLSGTLLLALFGLLTGLAQLCHVDLSRRPAWVRFWRTFQCCRSGLRYAA